MLKYLSRKIALQWIILLGLFALALFTILTKSQVVNLEGAPFLFQNFVCLFAQYEYLGKGIIIAGLCLQILLLQYYFRTREYAAKNSLLPTCFYLSILLLTKSLIFISPFFFTLFFLLIIISINFTGSSVKLKNNVFWAGIIIACASAFDTSSIILIFLVIVMLIINQYSRIKEIGILLFGFLLLYFYFFAFHFFINDLNDWILTFKQIKIMEILSTPVKNMTIPLISLLVLTIIYLFFIIKFKLLSDAKIMILRNRVITLNAISILILFCLLLSNSSYPDVLGYLFVSISIYLAMLAQEKSSLFMNEIITLITLIALWL